MPSCPSTVKPRWMTWMISRSCGMATARDCSRACATSYCSITFPLTATAPRLFTLATCAPAMLTSADVISRPEVDSAFSTERVIAWEAAARSTMIPFLIPSEGSMPTPRMRMDLSSSTRPTSVHTLVVPTSMPTTLSSILLNPVIGRSGVRHIDHCRTDASLRQGIHHRFIHMHLQLHVISTRPKIDLPATRVIPPKPITWVVNNDHARRDVVAKPLQRLHHFSGNEWHRVERI